MKAKPLAEETLRRFAVALSKHALGCGWNVTREMDGRSHRGFTVKRCRQELHLFVKVSQSDRGF
jgi:hypothetical protein